MLFPHGIQLCLILIPYRLLTYFKTPSNSPKGGVLLYVNKQLNAFERHDLQHDKFESIFVEIKINKGKNIICGCIYRHPRYNLNNLNKFISYFEKCLNKISKENREIYLCGDYNIDLLKIESNNNYLRFYNILCSFGFLPKIIQPIRITDNRTSLIDNMFTNNMKDVTLSGNLLLTLSEHFLTIFISGKGLY